MNIMLILAVFLAFFVSALMGQGGGLIMAPVMIAAFGPKEGVAIAAVLMAANNVIKAAAYLRSIPKVSFLLAIGTVAGTLIGSLLLVSVPEKIVLFAAMASILASFGYEVFGRQALRIGDKSVAVLFAAIAGITSGVSGTSGPLKAVSVRMMNLQPLRHVGAATVLSLVGDVTKAIALVAAGVTSYSSVLEVGWAFALMPLATWGGWYINSRKMKPQWFGILFWITIGAYLLRLAVKAF